MSSVTARALWCHLSGHLWFLPSKSSLWLLMRCGRGDAEINSLGCMGSPDTGQAALLWTGQQAAVLGATQEQCLAGPLSNSWYEGVTTV